MRACVAPKCYRTRRKKRGLNHKTLPGKCIAPNSWVIFMMRVSGQGLSRDEVSAKYAEWKSIWLSKNRGLSNAAAKAKMNKTLCSEVAQTTVFFAEREPPLYWSVTAHLRRVTYPFVFMVRGRPKTRQNMDSESTNRLQPRRWFNDDIVNAYMALLDTSANPGAYNCQFMSSFFYDHFTLTQRQTLGAPDPKYVNATATERHKLVVRWTANMLTTSRVKIFIPINSGNNHWSLIVIDVDNRKLFSFDSLGYSLKKERGEMLGWVKAEHKAKRVKFDAKKWTSQSKTVPLQQNGYDCGVFMCMFAAFLSNDKMITFSQRDIPKMRMRIAWSILHKKL